MPFLKHGMGGDCDGQPDDERAEDEPSHGVSTHWIQKKIAGSSASKTASNPGSSDSAIAAASKRVGSAVNKSAAKASKHLRTSSPSFHGEKRAAQREALHAVKTSLAEEANNRQESRIKPIRRKTTVVT